MSAGGCQHWAHPFFLSSLRKRKNAVHYRGKNKRSLITHERKANESTGNREKPKNAEDCGTFAKTASPRDPWIWMVKCVYGNPPRERTTGRNLNRIAIIPRKPISIPRRVVPKRKKNSDVCNDARKRKKYFPKTAKTVRGRRHMVLPLQNKKSFNSPVIPAGDFLFWEARSKIKTCFHFVRACLPTGRRRQNKGWRTLYKEAWQPRY